jgi:GT2 family glycosyltransferase
VSTNPILAIVPSFVRNDEEADVLLRCLVTLRQTAPDVAVLVVDDCSPAAELAASLEAAAEELGVAFVRKDSNDGFSATVNVGLEVARARGMDALLVNADIEFRWQGWLEAMLARTGTDGTPAAVVGARLLFPNGLLQHAGVYFSLLRRVFDHRFYYGPADLPEALVACRCPVTAALMLIRHDCLVDVGLFDEQFGLGFEDVDYCLRVFASGRECIYEPAAIAVHAESLFRGKRSARTDELHRKSSAWLAAKHSATDLSPWIPAIA